MVWFGQEHRITLDVDWVSREENTFADELSKMLIPDDYMLSRAVFHRLEERFGLPTMDTFASGSNN